MHKEEYENIYWIAASNLQKWLTMMIKQILGSKEEQLIEQGNSSVLESAKKKTKKNNWQKKQKYCMLLIMFSKTT